MAGSPADGDAATDAALDPLNDQPPAPAAAAAGAAVAGPGQPGTAAAAAQYFFSPTTALLSARLPVNEDRPALVHALIAALPSFLDGRTAVARIAPPATAAELAAFHSPAYLHLLAGAWAGADDAALAEAGLVDDCPPFQGLWEYAAALAGGTLAAARALSAGATHLAFALDGGRHHARPGRAAGFCYVNDAALACQALSAPTGGPDHARQEGGGQEGGGGGGRRRRRVLYLDVDAHAGDGVEAAFAGCPSVLTVSIHHAAPGFYPGTGGVAGAGGDGAGAGFALNLPLARGARDETFLGAATALGSGAVRLFRPDAIVLQLGADGLARDPVADAWSLTPAVFGRLTAAVRGWCRGGARGTNAGADAAGDGHPSSSSSSATPLLVLGGGGYDSVETAKAWACGVCGAAGVEPPADVPDHQHVGRYGPTWRLGACAVAPTVRDENDGADVAAGVAACLEGLRAGVEREWPGLSSNR